MLKLSAILTLFLAILFVTHSASAVEPTSTNSAGRFKDVKNQTSNAPLRKASTAAQRKVMLSEARLNICKTRAVLIGERFKNLLALGIKTHEKLDKTVERVDMFYNEKMVPEGLVLTNYDALKSDINVKQEGVHTALEKAQANGQAFSCDSEDPKTDADTFKQDIRALMAANKEYRTSVRNFVAAVWDLAKQARADKLSPSPVATGGAVQQ